jgi:hypothetical protein
MRSPSRSLLVLLSLAALSVSAVAAPPADARRPKKLIATGWDHPDSRRLRENLLEMEKRPFDGVVIELVGRIDEKKTCYLRGAFVNEPWRQEWFQSCVDDLRACKSKRLTDNFISIGANPGNVDWFDDEGWAAIVEHWRIAAWVAKQSGCKGLLFDPEPYAPPHAQFGYAAQPQRAKHTFDEYCEKARQRGRAVIEAVAKEYPDIVLFCYFMNSVNATATGQANPRRVLEGSGYGLYPAFIDGWLDAVPPTITLVDGCESAYLYNSRQQFVESALAMKGACQELVSPENRAKYRAQVQVSFGIYLDAYWNPKESPWYIDAPGGSRVDRLRANVGTALEAADEYVWIYGEKFRWWPTPNGGVRKESWPEALPGSDAALRFVRDPLDYARTEMVRLRQENKLVNLARNGDFSAERVKLADGREEAWREGRPPAGWASWQRDDSKGVFAWDRDVGAGGKGSARASGAADGCFIQSCDVKPGEHYAVRVMRRLAGGGRAHVRVRWQTPDGRWTLESQDRMIHADAPPGEWAELLGVVEVPEGVGRLVVLLGAGGQPSPQDAAWYDDVELYRLR